MSNVISDILCAEEYIEKALGGFDPIMNPKNPDEFTNQPYNLKNADDISAAHDLSVTAVSHLNNALMMIREAMIDLRLIDLLNGLENEHELTDDQRELLDVAIGDDYDTFMSIKENGLEEVD